VLKNSPKSLSREKKSTNHQRVPSNFSTQPVYAAVLKNSVNVVKEAA